MSLSCSWSVPANQLGAYGFICGWTLGNLAGALVVDLGMAKRGIPLVKQDFVLTCGMLAMVMAGFAMRHGLRDYLVLNMPKLVIDFLPAMVLTLIGGAVMFVSFPEIKSFRSGIFGTLEETDETDEEVSEVIEAILSTSEGNVISGGPQD